LAMAFITAGAAIAQTTVKGIVVSKEDGQPVIGATVRVVGQEQTATVTDVDGAFSLTVPAGKDQLKFTYINMEELIVPAKSDMRVAMQPNSLTLNEVIITGYGNFDRAKFTGSATTVSTARLGDVPAVSIEDKLQGAVAGLTFATNSGQPGAVTDIRLRGMGSINAGNDPLIVINGTPMNDKDASGEFTYSKAQTSPLALLNSNDIESVTVIKDAAAASLYGSRAANGVIVIKTKSGRSGRTNVSWRSDWGFSNLAIDYRPMLDGASRRNLLQEGLKNYALYNQGKTEAEAEAYAADNIDTYAAMPEGGYTDWKCLLFGTGSHQNYEVSVDGGNDNTRFYASASYLKQDGIVSTQGLERMTGSAHLTHTAGRFSLLLSTQFAKMLQNLSTEGTATASSIYNYAVFQSPSSSPYVYNEDGTRTLATACGSQNINPLYEQQHKSDDNDIISSLNTLQLSYNVWDNLRISERLTYNYKNSRETVIWDQQSKSGASYNGALQRSIVDRRQFNTQTEISYAKRFGLHDVDALAAFETEDYRYNYEYVFGSNFEDNLFDIDNAGSTSASGNKKSYRMTSFVSRLNYNYALKYFFGASFRVDGSSRLARSNRWGCFWSLSGAWHFTDESFMSGFKNILTDGKIRASYGVNGTQPSAYYDYLEAYKYGNPYNSSTGLAVVGVANPDLKWEKNYAFNLGLDLTFLDRYTLVLDYYTRTTKDLIFDMPISYIPGYYDESEYTATMARNVGSLRNSGFELTLSSVNFKTADLEWTTSLNIAHNSNKIKKLNGQSTEIIDGRMIHRVGEAYYSYYLLEYAGVDSETGSELYYINGDDKTTARQTTTKASEANRVIVGKHDPAVSGGITSFLRYKMLDFGFTFTYSLGGKALDALSLHLTNGGSWLYKGAVPDYYDITKTWKGSGDTTATLPKFQYGSAMQWSSRWLMPTDYLRLKSLSLGLSVPKEQLRRLPLERVRVYFAGSNLFTWKKKGLRVDPEMPVDGLCTLQTPAYRTFTFGIELGF